MQSTRMAHACAHDARTEIRSRLSPSRLEASSPELLHTCSYMLSVPIERLTYIRYKLEYRASGDIRCSLCAHRVLENRLSPSRLEANSPELLHTPSYMLLVRIARLTYVCYKLGYRASDDIRSVQKAPNIVASAISQFVAYIY